MYQKVATDLNFVDREKEVEKFWEDNHIFEKSMETARKDLLIPSMTDRLLQMENLISAMCLPV